MTLTSSQAPPAPAQTIELADPICLRNNTLRNLCVRAKFARVVVDRAVGRFPVRLQYPDGTIVDINRPAADLLGDSGRGHRHVLGRAGRGGRGVHGSREVCLEWVSCPLVDV